MLCREGAVTPHSLTVGQEMTRQIRFCLWTPVTRAAEAERRSAEPQKPCGDLGRSEENRHEGSRIRVGRERVTGH